MPVRTFLAFALGLSIAALLADHQFLLNSAYITILPFLAILLLLWPGSSPILSITVQSLAFLFLTSFLIMQAITNPSSTSTHILAASAAMSFIAVPISIYRYLWQ